MEAASERARPGRCPHMRPRIEVAPSQGYTVSCQDCGLWAFGNGTAKNAVEEFEKKSEQARKEEVKAR